MPELLKWEMFGSNLPAKIVEAKTFDEALNKANIDNPKRIAPLYNCGRVIMNNEGAAEVMEANTSNTMKRKEILNKAIHCVCGDREQDYGSPERSLKFISDLWELWLNNNCLNDGKVILGPVDASVMMCLFKIARIGTGHGKEDNWVDLAGYAANGGEIEFLMEHGGDASDKTNNTEKDVTCST